MVDLKFLGELLGLADEDGRLLPAIMVLLEQLAKRGNRGCGHALEKLTGGSSQVVQFKA